MSKRELRVVHAFVNCIKHGEMSVDYADLRIYDTASFGYLSNEAYDLYEELTAEFRPKEPIEEPDEEEQAEEEE